MTVHWVTKFDDNPFSGKLDIFLIICVIAPDFTHVHSENFEVSRGHLFDNIV